MNKEGYEDITDVLKRGTTALDPEAFEALANESGAVVLDVRHQSEFIKGHIPRSIFIGLDGGFAPWVGALIADVKHPILLVTPEGREEEAITRLARVGFDQTLGYLQGSFDAWKTSGKDYDSISTITASELKERMKTIVSPFLMSGKQTVSISKHSLSDQLPWTKSMHIYKNFLPKGSFYPLCRRISVCNYQFHPKKSRHSQFNRCFRGFKSHSRSWD